MRKLPMSADDLLEAGVLIYMRGLGFPTDRPASASSTEPPQPPPGPWSKPSA